MSEDSTISGTPEGGSGQAVTGASGDAPAATAAPEPAGDTTPPVSAPGSMFRPTMHDGSSASETGGRTVPVRPLETQPADSTAGEIVPCDGPDGPADQALILGPPTGEETGDGTDPVDGASDGTTAPALAADLIDGTNLFGDRAALWSGDPSEVGAGYGAEPPYAEICLCDATALAGGEVSDHAS